MRIEANVSYNGLSIKRYVVFTGDREGYLEDEAGNKTCLFSFEAFCDTTMKSLKDGNTYVAADLPISHPMFAVACAIRGAYTKRRMQEAA